MRKLLLFGLLLSFVINLHGTTIVAPSAFTAAEGNVNNVYPFSIGYVGFSSMRYQQIYSASEFGGIPVGGAFITRISLRPDAVYGFAFSTTLPDIQIDLSTTTVAVDALNNTFAANIGADDKVVLARGPLTLASTFTGPASGPKDFDIVINLTTPFFYNPTLGNLLLDVRNFGGGSAPPLDAVDLSNDSVSRAYAENGVNSPSALTGTPTLGLVTQFTAIPEPSPLTLLLPASAIIACAHRARSIKTISSN